tara:strand:- start:2064 stop:2231 length:168 start_codon:yes stop_codon:yes gene_type:complete
MTLQEAMKLRAFHDAYYENQVERETWNDNAITKEQFFEVWLRRDEECNTLKKSST